MSSVLPRISEAEYLSLEAASPEKHEFVNGELWLMAGGTYIHNLVASNLVWLLKERLGQRGFEVLGSDQRVHVEATGLYCYPDATVVCGPPRLVGAEPRSLANPRVVIEVLSPSTAAFDKDVKFAHYRRCASIEVIVFVSQPDRRVEVYTRVDGGWRLDEGRDAEVLRIPALDADLPLDAVYRGVDAALAADEP